MRKIIILFISVLLAYSYDASASKAMPRKFDVVLTDGTSRTVTLVGDEHYRFYASTLGELIIRERDTWRLATDAEMAEADRSLSRAKAMRANEQIIGTRPFPHVGNPRALVIMVDFTDQSFTYGKDVIDRMFNSMDYDSTSGLHNYSSLAQYMNDCSFGQYRPVFDITGPFHLSNTVQYYGRNSGGTDANYSAFIRDACMAADAEVDFSRYDSDGDGYVDLVYIVYAGYGENWGYSEDYLYPKSGVGSFGTYDGVQVYRYGFNQELSAYPGITGSDGKPMANGIGLLCHEFCHTLGLCDIYPTARWSDLSFYDNQSMEYWDLMDNGENNYNGYAPTPLTAWQRELLGWMQIETLDQSATVDIMPIDMGGKAYRIYNDNDATRNEYYILESIPNGKDTGWYRRMRGNGLLVTHVNYDANAFSNFNSPNNVQGKPRMTVLAADNIVLTSYRLGLDSTSPLYITSDQYYADHAGDTYPGTTGLTQLTDYKAYSGTVDKPITDILQTGWNISLKFMGGSVADAIGGIQSDESTDRGGYNIAGQKVDGSYKGIIIKNGKKTIQ